MQSRLKRFTRRKTTIQWPEGRQIGDVILTDWEENFSVKPGLENVQGDRKTPTNSEFSRQVTQCFKGSRFRRDIPGPQAQEISGTWGSYPALGVVSPDTVSNNVYNEALGKLHDTIRGGVDLSVDLLQAGQTARMFKGAKATLDYVRTYNPVTLAQWYLEHKRDKRNYHKDWWREHGTDPKSAARSVGSRWLEFQYGWKPLAQDIYDGSVELQKFLPTLLRAKGRAHANSVFVVNGNISDSGYNFPYTGLGERGERVEIACTFAIKPSALAFISNFTTLNPVGIGWELVPYSFVVDWFLDIGGYLRALETAYLLHGQWQSGYVTKGSITSVRADFNKSFRANGYDWNFALSGGSNLFTWKQRSKLTSAPWPMVPKFKADLGSGRLLNAAALLSQFLGRKGRR